MIDDHQVGVHVERFPPSFDCLNPFITDIFINIAGKHWCAANTVLR